jgi:hypothetical protein
LDLGLFVDAEHQRALGGIQVDRNVDCDGNGEGAVEKILLDPIWTMNLLAEAVSERLIPLPPHLEVRVENMARLGLITDQLQKQVRELVLWAPASIMPLDLLSSAVPPLSEGLGLTTYDDPIYTGYRWPHRTDFAALRALRPMFTDYFQRIDRRDLGLDFDAALAAIESVAQHDVEGVRDFLCRRSRNSTP